MVEQYLQDIKDSNRELRRRAILQRACNRLSPGQVTSLYLSLDEIGGKKLCALAPQYEYFTSAKLRRASRKVGFRHQEVAENIWVYRRGEVSRADKRLIIFISGGHGEFMIPFSMILHNLPSGPMDVYSVSSQRISLFRDGIKSVGENQFEIAKVLKSITDSSGYRHVSVCGLSIGGMFALAVAEMMNADTGISISGVYPFEILQLTKAHGTVLPAFDPLCGCRNNQSSRLINVLALKSGFDVDAARRVKRGRPGLSNHFLLFSGTHNVLGLLRRRRVLRPFLWLLFQEKPTLFIGISRVLAVCAEGILRLRQLLGRQQAKWYLRRQEQLVDQFRDGNKR